MERHEATKRRSRVTLREMLAADWASEESSKRLGVAWQVRSFLAAVTLALAIGHALNPPAVQRQEMTILFVKITSFYVAATALGYFLHRMRKERRWRVNVSMLILIVEIWQISMGFLFRGPADPAAQSYTLALVAIYPLYVGFWHGIAAIAGALLISGVIFVGVIMGWYPYGGLLSIEQPSPEVWSNLVSTTGQGLVAVIFFAVSCFIFGLQVRWKERRVWELNNFIVDGILRRYLPAGLAGRLLSEGTEWASPRRTEVTIFFSDIVGFSRQSEKLPPEDLAAVLDEYLEAMVEIAHKHGGAVDKFIGDAVMILFGAPSPMEPEEQAIRSVAMALEMQRRIPELSVNRVGFTPNIRVGIHSGVAAVGNFGGPSRSDFTAIGDTVNIASRLESNAKPGTVLVSKVVWERLGGSFNGTSLGSIAVKGREEEIEVWEIDSQVAGAQG